MKKDTSPVSFLLPRLQDILFILIFFTVILLGSNLFRDGDPGRHITIGKYILQTLTIPTHDLFSYTMAGQPLTPHEWLAQVAYGAGYMALGLNGVVLIAAVLIAATVTLIYREILRRTTSPLFSLGFGLLAAAATMIHWLARPHLFTFLYVALWTVCLSRLATPSCGRCREGQAVPLWHFPVIMLLWANTHGAFIAGFVIWGAYLAEALWFYFTQPQKPDPKTARNLLVAGGTSFLATFINPVGWRLWTTSAGYITNRYLVDLTSEYRSADFHQPGAWPFIILLMLALFALSRAWKKLPLAEGLLLTGWAFLGIYSARNIPLFAIVTAPILADYCQPIIQRISLFQKIDRQVSALERQLRGFLWPLAAILLVSALLLSGHKLDAQKQGYQFNPVEFPVEAANWLEQNPQAGNMYDYFPWGGYLIYRFWPEQRVFIDGQLDFYGEEFTREYKQILSADEGWEDLVAQYDIAWMLIPPDEPLAILLHTDPGWARLYEDQTAVIFRKR